jgi:SAM-dependent methyltransferase
VEPGFSAAIRKLHGLFVRESRADAIARNLTELIAHDAKTILDVGCGDGLIDQAIMARRGDLAIEGIDLFPRPEALIPVRPFDGRAIPCADKSYDAVIFIDVLHHAADPRVLLQEAARVARQSILIKDHFAEGQPDRMILRFMDLIGNAGYSFAWSARYWPRQRWQQTFEELNLSVIESRNQLGLYPAPASRVFERTLHFAARLDLNAKAIPARVARGPECSAGKLTG